MDPLNNHSTIKGEIYKLDDDWFVVSMHREFHYKCDQIDGLIHLLKKIKKEKSTKILENNIQNSNDYYYPIDYNVFTELQRNAIDINLSNNQIKKIEQIFNQKITKRNYQFIFFDENNTLSSKEIPFIFIKAPLNNKDFINNRIEIFRLNDEWFLINWPEKNIIGGEHQKFYSPYGDTYKFYAKCDQFDGVIKLLILIKNIHKY